MTLPAQWRLLAALGLTLLSGTALAEAPSNAELQQQIEELKQQIRLLTEKLSGQPAASPELGQKVKSQEQQLQAQQEQIEALAQQAEENKKADWLARTKIGGYGELHYNNLEGKGGASDKEEIDFHRFVLLFGHDFNERLRFRSELEVEHAFIKDNVGGTASPGEVEVEQAYVEYDINQNLQAKGGLFLIPVGILNETHEPPTFYGVERNPVENAIIPTTWWAGGAGLTWRFREGWALDAAIHEGLKTSVGSKFAVRNGRQKTASADAEDLASTFRLKWTGMPGLELAATYQFQKDITQQQDATPAQEADEAGLFETHAIYQRGPFGLRALYASWDIDGEGAKLIGADKQEGYYLEPSWRFNPEWGVFARYSEWDNQAGSGSPGNTEKVQSNIGFNYWPHPNVVVKADYQKQDNDDDKNQDGINLGVGYQF
jgi:hypothetical protein